MRVALRLVAFAARIDARCMTRSTLHKVKITLWECTAFVAYRWVVYHYGVLEDVQCKYEYMACSACRGSPGETGSGPTTLVCAWGAPSLASANPCATPCSRRMVRYANSFCVPSFHLFKQNNVLSASTSENRTSTPLISMDTAECPSYFPKLSLNHRSHLLHFPIYA